MLGIRIEGVEDLSRGCEVLADRMLGGSQACVSVRQWAVRRQSSRFQGRAGEL